MHKLESVLENETHKILWDFEIQIDHPTLARSSDQVMIYKKKNEKLSRSGRCSPGGPQSENQRNKK